MKKRLKAKLLITLLLLSLMTIVTILNGRKNEASFKAMKENIAFPIKDNSDIPNSSLNNY